MTRRANYLLLLLLVAACFSLAAVIQPRTEGWRRRSGSDSSLMALLGDGRRLFANHFFVKADVYFHSGYYPTVFDQAETPKDSRHMTAAEGSNEAEEHERKMNFLGPPRDWIERFGRHFIITDHTHLAGNQEREILPWLKISAELDPQRIDTYTVASYWLRRELGKPQEAEKFLREGLRYNPNSYELLYELGRLYSENYTNQTRAVDLWELALRRWHEQQDHAKEPDKLALEEIAVHLARAEEDAGHFEKALTYLETAAKLSAYPEGLQKQIAELRQKLASGGSSPPSRPGS